MKHEEAIIETGGLGKVFKAGEQIVRQGEVGDCMYVIQDGQAEVVRETDGQEIRLRVLGIGDLFGEMAIVDHEVRSATVRALGDVRVLTIDKNAFLRRVHEDPSLAYRVVQAMSSRIRDLTVELARTKSGK